MVDIVRIDEAVEARSRLAWSREFQRTGSIRMANTVGSREWRDARESLYKAHGLGALVVRTPFDMSRE